MSIECARAVLRLIAVTTMVIGAVVTTMTVIGLIAWGQARIAVADTSWSGSLGMAAILAHASIVAWGLALFLASPRLARLVTT